LENNGACVALRPPFALNICARSAVISSDGTSLRAGCVCLIATGLAVLSFAAAEMKKEEPDLREKIERWQQEMTDAFRDTSRKLRSERSTATASVDLREQQESYTVRLNVPKRDLNNVQIILENETLRIVAPKERDVGRYEQTVVLQCTAGAGPRIDRKPKDGLIVAARDRHVEAVESRDYRRRGFLPPHRPFRWIIKPVRRAARRPPRRSRPLSGSPAGYQCVCCAA
jgi:HSP20 family molecular chaperone IbpA